MGNTETTLEAEVDEQSDTPRLYQLAKLQKGQWPILYAPVYNIGFLGLEKIHPFDSGKWGKVFQFLIDDGMLEGDKSIVHPHEATRDELKITHSDRYLDSLNRSYNVAMVVEVPPVAILPNSVVQNRMLKPFRYQTGGTIMAGKLAKEQGWAINIGGGFHHCSSDEGGGFCAYADITLTVKFMFQHLDGISKVMIVDFDAHQGNGHERDFMNDDRVYIMDMYNRWIYPNDKEAKFAISTKIELDVHTEDLVYLDHIESKLPKVLDEFKPDIIVYNAGTDVLLGDPLGALDITPDGVVERDRLVFSEARTRNIPIVMVTSGGYQRSNARVIADSILNLQRLGLINSPEEDPHLTSELRLQGAPLDPPDNEEHDPPLQDNKEPVTGQSSEPTGQVRELSGQDKKEPVTGQSSEPTGQVRELSGQDKKEPVTGQSSEPTGQVRELSGQDKKEPVTGQSSEPTGQDELNVEDNEAEKT